MDNKDNKEYLKKTIESLSQPLPYKWKLQSYTKDKSKALCVAYIDARDVNERLNTVCEFGYHTEHYSLGTDIYCRIGLIMPDGSVIWRSDVGESNNETEKSKTAASDSFKRAAVQFGVGRFLYELDIVKLPVKQDGQFYNIIDDNGNKVWDLTEHINKMKSGTKVDSKPVTKAKVAGPKPTLDELTPTHKSWAYTVKRVKEGVPLEQIKKSFVISSENETKLTNEAK